MKTLEIIGYQRANLGKQASKRLRSDAQVPGVLYGGGEQISFHVPMGALKPLVYTSDAHFVQLKIEDKVYRCILQDIQFHPVSEMILHIDLLQIFEDRPVKMQIPITTVGTAPGVTKGGELAIKLRKLPVLAYPKNMPEKIQVDVSALDLGQMARVRDVKSTDYTILSPAGIPVVVIAIPRALRSAVANKAE